MTATDVLVADVLVADVSATGLLVVEAFLSNIFAFLLAKIII